MKKIIIIFTLLFLLSININWYAFDDYNITNENSFLSEIETQKSLTLKNLNNEILNSFKIKVLNNKNYFLENWVWYTYLFNTYKKFWTWVTINQQTISYSNLNTDNTILLLDENTNVSFVTQYKKIKLISDEIITGITNKEEFLKQIIDDKKYYSPIEDSIIDSDEIFIKLKNETTELTQWLSQKGKIYKIYDYLLNNLEYIDTFSIDNKTIFSWIETYKNKVGVCWWYSKLNLYMLSFAWIDNVELKTWYVLDSVLFPNIWHAWVKIWESYYDPTFDDPIWNIWAKKYSEYKYFWLPEDIFYINKYEYWKLPENIKEMGIEERKLLINKNYLSLKQKYINQNYLVLSN